MESKYVLSVLKPQNLPKQSLPEIALLGRSNSGKSSFINTVLNKKNLAKTSKFPGRTQTINFFEVESKLFLVDIPGYGFARSDSIVTQYWQDLVQAYLKRDTIKYIVFLQDIRRSLNEEDIWVLKNTLNCDKLVVILTKSDKLSSNQIRQKINEYSLIMKQAGIDYDSLIDFSILKRKNIGLVSDKLFSEFGLSVSY